MSKWCGDENCLQCADKEPDPYVHLPRADYEALREQNRVLVKALDDIRKKSYEPDSERPDRLSTRAQIQLMAEAALTATSQPGGTHEI
ncbi:MAG: hypothetical protein GDA68_18740 [Nitrospira sp. CR2.1]|nr:hypothetical protein [Nitrospira sp. CR2.1]MBA5875224.1 hypothetical protein [Nitrospira sp. CR1.2]